MSIHVCQQTEYAANLFEILRFIDDKLDLVVMAVDILLEHREIQPARFVCRRISAFFSLPRCCMSKLRAKRYQIAADRLEHGARRFDRNMLPAPFERGGQFADLSAHHRLAAGDDDIAAGVLLDPPENFRKRPLRALRPPGCVRGIAPDAAQIAA